jgi:TolA-binding protein
LALSLLGVGYDAKGDCTLAIANWMRIESSPDLKFLGGDSALKTGACYEKLGKTDKAKETYERILKDYKDDTSATQAARKFLRTLGQKG